MRPQRSDLIAKANSQFHEALDEIELELVRTFRLYEDRCMVVSDGWSLWWSLFCYQQMN